MPSFTLDVKFTTETSTPKTTKPLPKNTNKTTTKNDKRRKEMRRRSFFFFLALILTTIFNEFTSAQGRGRDVNVDDDDS